MTDQPKIENLQASETPQELTPEEAQVAQGGRDPFQDDVIRCVSDYFGVHCETLVYGGDALAHEGTHAR